MPQDSKQPGLSWSTPKSAAPSALEPVPAPAGDAPHKPVFPSSKKPLGTQAPMYAGFLVAGIVIGALLATYGLHARQGEASLTATSTPEAEATSTPAPAAPKTPPTEAPLVVADQPAGPSVAITRLTIARPTWAVVYASRGGSPGNALGARLFFAGDQQGKVGLLRSTVAGQSYFVGLSVDNGDSVFSLSKDRPLADAGGGPLWATFSAR
jgi:hypothetical protein